MPELPEVETVRQGLLPAMQGKTLKKLTLNRKNLRFPFDENLNTHLENKKITNITRRSKYLLIHFEQDNNKQTLIAHLGMSGKFTIFNNNEAKMRSPEKHDHVIFLLNDGTEIIYNDPRRFGFLLLADNNDWQNHKLIKHIGVEPLTTDFSPKALAKKSTNKQTNIKNHLLNQKIVAGLGNIYVCEALFRAKIHPKQPAKILSTATSKATKTGKTLVPIIKDILQTAIKAGGSSLKDYRQTDGNLGYFQHSFAVYGRENQPCTISDCSATIQRMVQSGRSTFFCPHCQKP